MLFSYFHLNVVLNDSAFLSFFLTFISHVFLLFVRIYFHQFINMFLHRYKMTIRFPEINKFLPIFLNFRQLINKILYIACLKHKIPIVDDFLCPPRSETTIGTPFAICSIATCGRLSSHKTGTIPRFISFNSSL